MNNLAVFWIMGDWIPEPLAEWLLNMPVTDIEVGVWMFGDCMVSISGSTDKEVTDKRKAFNTMIEANGYGPDISRM